MTLEEITSAVRPISYGILMPKANVADGVLYVRVVDFKENVIDLGGVRRTAPAIAAAYARTTLRSGDILLSIRGTYGRVAAVPPELDGGNITQDTVRLSIITPALEPRFVELQLRSPRVQQYLRAVARGVAVKGVNVADVRVLPVVVPPVDEQRAIVQEAERHVSLSAAVRDAVARGRRRSVQLRAQILNEVFPRHSPVLASAGNAR